MVPGELTNEELLELEQECTAKEEARGTETAGKEKEGDRQENSPEGFSRGFLQTSARHIKIKANHQGRISEKSDTS